MAADRVVPVASSSIASSSYCLEACEERRSLPLCCRCTKLCLQSHPRHGAELCLQEVVEVLLAQPSRSTVFTHNY